MKECKKCFRLFDEDIQENYSPAGDLGDIFLKEAGTAIDEDICPDCREEFGILNLLGFRQ